MFKAQSIYERNYVTWCCSSSGLNSVT